MAISLRASPSIFIPSPAPRTSPSICSLSSSVNCVFLKDCHRCALKFQSNRAISLTSRRAPRRRRGLDVRCLFGLGVPELVVIAGVAALVFGPKKLPEIGRGIGKTVKSFQQAAKEFETELKKTPEDATEAPPEKPTAASKQEESREKPAAVSDSKQQDPEVLGRKETL